MCGPLLVLLVRSNIFSLQFMHQAFVHTKDSYKTFEIFLPIPNGRLDVTGK